MEMSQRMLLCFLAMVDIKYIFQTITYSTNKKLGAPNIIFLKDLRLLFITNINEIALKFFSSKILPIFLLKFTQKNHITVINTIRR